MAIPASRQPPQVAKIARFLPGVGIRHAPLLPVEPAPAPVQQASYIVASDAAQFSVAARQTVVVPFPNLPNRSLGGALRTQSGTVVVRPFDTLHFAVAVQNANAQPASVAPQVTDVKGTKVRVALLAGGTAYEQFAAVITAGAMAVAGTVTGTLSVMVN